MSGEKSDADVIPVVVNMQTILRSIGSAFLREVKHLEHRADQAEGYANTAIFLAMATMEAAEKATLEAIVARRDAEIAIGTNQA